MMSLKSAVSPKLRTLVQRSIVEQHGGIRPMTVLSKESAEEYKKQVRKKLDRMVEVLYWALE